MSIEFHDVVRIDGPDAPGEVRGKTGRICACGFEPGEPIWGVFVYELEMVWSLGETVLVPLGYKDEIALNREPLPPIRVGVDPETGWGEIVDG